MSLFKRFVTRKHPSQSGNDSYDQYEKQFLICQDKLIPIARKIITEDGFYDLIFTTQVVNNTASWEKPTNIMIAAKLFINGVKSGKGWTENINPSRHYGNPILHRHSLLLKQGDCVEVMMRADSTKLVPAKSIFILTDPDRFQFDVVKV